MSDTEMQIAVAKLDGFSVVPTGNGTYPFALKSPSGLVGIGWMTEAGAWSHGLPHYLTSRDAIIPVIEKQKAAGLSVIANELYALCRTNHHDKDVCFMLATPRHICIALLKATGHFKD